MARPLRIEYEEAVYHVTSRGNARDKIFSDGHDKEKFLEELDSVKKRYKKFVMEGISKESPWREIRGQIILGGEGFVEKFKDLLADKEKIKEIPRHQRYMGRPSLADIFKQEKTKGERNRKIWAAHLKFGYTLKEIADCLGIHYTTVSKVLMDKI